MSQGTDRDRVRKSVALALVGLGLAGLLASAAVLLWLRIPGVQPALPAGILAADKSLGVNADLSRLDRQEREVALAAMEDAGLLWVRQRFPWDGIEAAQGVYDWSIWDEIVEDVQGHKLGLIAVLDGSPVWARAGVDRENPLAPPVKVRSYGDFVAAFASRYADSIDHYQIWDEPNIAPHWGSREIDPSAYADLLREGAIRIRNSDPGAVILTAALAPNAEPGGANMSELLFLDALYDQGAAEWFDVVAAQPYDFAQPADAPSDPGSLNWNRLSLLRQVMEQNSDGATAVWAVSFGASERIPHVVGELVQHAREEWPWLGPMLWAAWAPGDTHGEYALTSRDGMTGPLYQGLRTSATAPVVAWPGNYLANHPSGRYEGDWRVTSAGADNGTSGDLLSISFQGTRLDLAVRRGDYRAFLFVSIDGGPANGLPRDSEGRSYVVLYDPLQETAAVTLARGLPDGAHLAQIEADRGWGQWTIFGWSILRETGQGRRLAPVLLILIALMVLGVTTALSWPNRLQLQEACGMWIGSYRALDDRLVLAITGGAAVLVYAVAGTAPTLAALALLAFLLLLRPETGLPLVAFALPFYQPGVALMGKVFSMVEILILLTALGWALNWIARREYRVPRPSKLDWGVIALVIVGLLSLLWAEHRHEAAREFRTVILESAIFYALLRAMAPKRRDAWYVADAWVLGGVVIALVGLIQWAFGQNLISAEGVWRVRGFYGSPNNLALYLGRVFPLALAVAAFAASSDTEVGQRKRVQRRWLYAIAALVMAMALFFTYSRGAWLLGVPVSLLFLAAVRGRRTLVVVAGLLLVAAVAGALVVGPGRLISLLDTAEGTIFFRLQLWQSSWAMIGDHPVLGVGLDNFLYHYRTFYVLPTAWEEFNLSHPHNLVFDSWLRLGLMGLGAMLWLLVVFFRKAWRSYRRLPEGADKLLVLGLMGGMVNFVAHGLVDNAFFLVDLACVFMIMLALAQVFAVQEPGMNDAGHGQLTPEE